VSLCYRFGSVIGRWLLRRVEKVRTERLGRIHDRLTLVFLEGSVINGRVTFNGEAYQSPVGNVFSVLVTSS
jgi:hypothetical protein